METEHDALAEPEAGEDPFDGVEADAGGDPDPDLVAEGSLGGENPSEEQPEPEEDPLAEKDGADPLAEPEQGEFMEDPEGEAEAETPAEEPAPEPEPTPEPPEPAPEETPPEPEGEAEETPPEPEPERRRSAQKGKRDYVVVQCDKKDKPVAIAGEKTARTDRDARRLVFDEMEDKEARLVAVPARYWNVKTLKKKTREVNDIEES